MKTVQRVTLLAVFALSLAAAGCEDDPNDLDFLKEAGAVDSGTDSGIDGGPIVDACMPSCLQDSSVATDDSGSEDAGN